MKKAFFISTLCTFLFVFTTGSAIAQITSECTLDADETTRKATARALLQVNASNYLSLINHWAVDIIYKEPVLTNSGRQEMLDYLDAVYAGSKYGFPNDKAVTIKDELASTKPDGSMTYMATIQWSGTWPKTSDPRFFIQKGMSIIQFSPGEGCPSFHRDYFTEGDTWWNIPHWQLVTKIFREVYINQFGLTERCFDDDGDGYTKYGKAKGCPNIGLDCNDFDAAINPGATEILGNGIDDDCKSATKDN